MLTTFRYRARIVLLSPSPTLVALVFCLAGAAVLAGAVVLLGPSPLVLPLAALWVVTLAPRPQLWAPVLLISLLLLHFVLSISIVLAGVNLFVSDLILIGLIAAVAVGGGSARRWERSRLSIGLGLNWLMIAFYADLLLSAAIGLIHGHDIKSVVNGTKELLSLSVFFLTPRLLSTAGDARRWLVVLLGSTGAAALYDVFNRLTGIGYYPYNASAIEVTLTTGTVSRAYGLITAAPFYVTATVVALALLAVVPMRRSRQQLGVLYSTLIIFLTLIQLIRGLFLGLIVGLLMLGILLPNAARLKLMQFGTLLVLIILAISAVTSIGGQSGISTMGQRFVSIILPDASSTDAQATRQQRLDYIFNTYQEVAADGSQVLGKGLGFPPDESLDSFDRSAMGHSFVGWLIRDCGLLGLGLYLLLIGAFFHNGRRVLRIVTQPEDRAIVIGVLASVAALLVASLGGNFLFDSAYGGPLFAFLLAIPTAIGARYGRVARYVPGTAQTSHPLNIPTATERLL